MSYLQAVDVSQCIRAWGEPDTLNGYSRVSLDSKVYYAHRLAYVAANGAIPQGYHVHHLCENKMCVNPSHLVAVTLDDHLKMHIKPASGKYYANQEFCKQGHRFDATYTRKDGSASRICRVCKRKTAREWAKANQEKKRATFKRWYYKDKENSNVVR